MVDKPRRVQQDELSFRLLVESVIDYAIFLLDASGHVTSWNAGAARLKGYTADEIIGQHFSIFYPPESRDKPARELEIAARDGRVEDEGWRVRKDGTRFWANVVITALRDETGKLVGFAKVTRELTERLRNETERRREEAERARRELLQAMMRAIPDGITLQDATGRLLFANAAAAEATGFESPEALLAARIEDVVGRFEMFDETNTPFPADRLPGRVALETRAPAEVLVRVRRRGDAQELWRLITAAPVFDGDGRVLYAVNVFRDVTERRVHEQQQRFLLHADERFHASLDHEETLQAIAREIVPALADWCAIDLLEGDQVRRLVVTHTDPAMISFVEDFGARYPADPSSPASPRQVILQNKPYLVEQITTDRLRARVRDEEQLRLLEKLKLTSFMIVPMGGHAGAIGAITLATAESRRVYGAADLAFATTFADRAGAAVENARLLRREKEARSAAEQAARLSNFFVGVLGHDLRSPLAAIAISGQQLLRSPADERTRKIAARIVSATERMTRMIEQLLDLTRIRLGGGLRLERERFDFAALALAIAEEIEVAFGASVDVASHGDSAGVWDRDRLGQVLANLLGNAAQHGTRGVPVRVAIDGRDAKHVRVEIKNAGRVPPTTAADIFAPFSGSRTGRGLGLGLYITQQIILAHGGQIELAAPGDADETAFVIRLPR